MLARWLVNHLIGEMAQGKLQESMATGEESASDEPPPPCELAFLFALGVESAGLVALLESSRYVRVPGLAAWTGQLAGRWVWIVDTGVGRKAARQATERLLSGLAPEWVVSAGFAGGLCSEIRRGHILMADTIADTEGRELEVGLRMSPEAIAATRGLHMGRLLTVPKLIRDGDEKRQLGERHEALACDMESMAVADVCRERKTRFLSVRVVSDGVDDTLPPEIDSLVAQQSTAGKLGAAARALFERPGSVKDMWKLKEDAIQAADRLARFLIGVVKQL